jgi:diguanylate cyclase (GGDEF)-like protein/PAS domain S-box-containing protein
VLSLIENYVEKVSNMKSNTIITKVKLLAAIPMLIIAMVFIFFVIRSNTELGQLKILQENVVEIENIANLMNELQRERGISNGYLGSKGKLFYIEMQEQRRKTDQGLALFNEPTLKNKILKRREAITQQKLSYREVFDAYSLDIQQLLEIYLKTSVDIDDAYVSNNFQSGTDLAIMKESLSQIRGAFSGIFSLEVLDRKLLNHILYANGMYSISEHKFMATASSSIKNDYLELIKTDTYKLIQSTINHYTTQAASIKDSSRKWWDNITEVIDKLYVLEINYFHNLDVYVAEKSSEIQTAMLVRAIMFMLLVFFILTLGNKITQSILRNIRLLSEYKDAVDRSSIVSKTNSKGVITYVNEKFCDISGYTSKELLGKPHNIIRHKDMPSIAFKELWKNLKQKKSWSGIVKNEKKGGGSYTVEATISPILNHHGEVEEYIAIRNDLTDVISLQEELKETQKDVIIKMSEIVESRSQETGHHVHRVAAYTGLLAKYSGLSDTVVQSMVNASPMHDIGKVAIPDNILNKPSKLTAEEWEIMKTHAKIGYDLFKDSSHELLKMAAIIAHEHHEKYDGSGYPRGVKGEEIHIYGRITALADVLDALASDRVYKKAWDKETIQAYIKDQRAKHFDPRLVDIYFEHLEEFDSIRTKYQDSTLIVETMKAKFQRNEETKYDFFDINPIPMIIVDIKRTILKVNQQFIALFGYKEEELLGKQTNILTISEESYFVNQEFFDETLKGEKRSKEIEYRKKDGTSFWVRLEGMPIKEEHGSVSVLWSFLDIDSEINQQKNLEALNEELKGIATRDALTNLHNRRYLMDIGEDIFFFHQKENLPFCVLMIDIDHFKNLNDTYGHLKGDMVLKSFGSSLLSFFRKSDIIFRYGGEEFTVILRNITLDEGYEIADNFRKSIEEYSQEIPITISLGIAQFNDKDDSMLSIISRADKALYRAKKEGRNRVAKSITTSEDQ